MRELSALVGVSALALLLVAAVVVAGHDTTVLVSPPEAVAEQFMRKVAERRYDMALEQLETGNRGMLPVVRALGATLQERAGAIDQVEGDSSTIAGDAATATVTVSGNRGDVKWLFDLVRRTGEWKIRETSLPR
jgi:hypothetical protein